MSAFGLLLKYDVTCDFNDFSWMIKDKETDEQFKYENTFHIERLNALQLLYVTNDRKTKVLETYYLDEDRKLKSTYVVISKR